MTAVRRTLTSALVALAAAAALLFGFTASASAVLAAFPGPNQVCASSLTQHLDDGSTVTLGNGHNFVISGFSPGRVYGYNQGSRHGWVLNGWFCWA